MEQRIYKVVDMMFFASDILVKDNLSEQEAMVLSQELNQKEVDFYRWYEVKKMNNHG